MTFCAGNTAVDANFSVVEVESAQRADNWPRCSLRAIIALRTDALIASEAIGHKESS